MEWKKLLSDKKLYCEPPEDKRLDASGMTDTYARTLYRELSGIT